MKQQGLSGSKLLRLGGSRRFLAFFLFSLLCRIALAGGSGPRETGSTPRFEISFSRAVSSNPVSGRLILILATKQEPEPRMTVSPNGPALLAIDIEQLQPEQSVAVDEKAITFPRPLAELPAGDYYAQAIINVYTQVHRSDGHTISVHMNDGREEFFNTARGNLYSGVQKVHLGSGGAFQIKIDHIIPPQEAAPDTDFVKHVRIRSEKLSTFWGYPIYVNATVLLPKGYDEHPTAHYPTVFTMGHDVPFTFDPKPETGAERATTE